jgi:hypothetical protein
MQAIGIRQDITPPLPLSEITITGVPRQMPELGEGQVLVSGVRSLVYDGYMDYCPDTEDLHIVESPGDLAYQVFKVESLDGVFHQLHWYVANLDDCLRARSYQSAA